MNCDAHIEYASYGSQLFCKTCGMDIELGAVKVHHKGGVFLYCCEDCAKSG